MREKFRQFMVGRYGTDGLNQALSIASIVMLLISLLTRISLFTWLGLVLLILCYYRSLSRNISKRTEGPVKILGPAVVPLRGGMGGTYLATTGEAGRAVLHCRMEGALDTEAYLTIRCRE